MGYNYFDMNQNESKILQFLVWKRWYRPALITELSKEFDKTWNTISDAANSLEEKGLIKRENGSLKIVKENKANYYFKLFVDRLRINGLNENLKSIIAYTLSRAQEVTDKAKSELLSLLIFGSVASGESDEKSDIDLLVILKDPRKDLENPEEIKLLEGLKENIISKKHISFGNINIIVMSDKEFEQGYLNADDLLITILSNNLVVYDNYLWTFMQRELFIPSDKTIFNRMEQLEKNKQKLLELVKLDNDEKLKEEFYNYLIKEARVELLRKKMPIPAITKKDVIEKIKEFNKDLYNEIVNISKNNIKQKVLHYVSQ